MSVENKLRDYFLADDDLMGILIGGVYAWSDDSNTNGINELDTPDAYGTYGVLQPCCVVKSPNESLTGGINDRKVHSVSRRVEIWVYDEGRNGREDAVTPAIDRITELIDAEVIEDVGHVRRVNPTIDGRDFEMLNALFTRADFQVVGVKGNG